jgi:aminoglycoside 6'-N-acetyltransferase I
MIVREATPDDLDGWAEMRAALWPDADRGELRAECEAFFAGAGGLQAALVACAADGTPVGMIELSLRSYAEGCASSPVPFVEAWFVAEGRRRQGVGRALMAAAEAWALDLGHTELASDTQAWNTDSQAAHAALGFEEADRIVAFRKALV